MKPVQKGNKVWTNNGQFVLCPSNVSPLEALYLKDFASRTCILYQTAPYNCIFFHLHVTRLPAASLQQAATSIICLIRQKRGLCSSLSNFIQK